MKENILPEDLAEKQRLDDIFTKRFKKLIEQKGEQYRIDTGKKLTNIIIASDLGISKTTMVSYQTQVPQLTNLIKISKYFNVSLEYLTGLSDNKKFVDYSLGKQYGLSDEAIDNMKKVHDYAIQYGYDTSKNDIRLFALNQLLTLDINILSLIGNFLSYPTIDNRYFDKFNISNKDYENVYKPDINFYRYDIYKLLADFFDRVRSSEVSVKMFSDKVWKEQQEEYIFYKENQLDFTEENEAYLEYIKSLENDEY